MEKKRVEIGLDGDINRDNLKEMEAALMSGKEVSVQTEKHAYTIKYHGDHTTVTPSSEIDKFCLGTETYRNVDAEGKHSPLKAIIDVDDNHIIAYEY